ncbi:MAG: hypothetical protein IPJ46_13935 [Anaerolineales bacterium]|uniref:hypothetical protein n=1 Tax=Candidatus Villigracilis saccharophilus TaxID=3140684 RepID=UPI0031354347|nr:hypothetical protein [Anaerolineales bacterium]MBK8419908.1 hypothetical protein [Anaerolineales bacterium]
MNIKSLLQRIQHTFKPQEELQDEAVLKFLHILENARAEEMSCGDLYAHLDEFVEREVQSKDAEKIAPLIREHLDICSECCEEYEALLNVIEHTTE